MDPRVRWAAAAAIVLIALAGFAGVTGLFGTGQYPAEATVTITSPDGEPRGAITAEVAATWLDRYIGLSRHDTLGPNEGMLFVHDTEDEYTYVMRGMSFPIDIVFIDADGRVTAIHHAEPEPRPHTPYEGRGKYVLETPHHWTTTHNVSSGDHVTIEWP